ncbi:HAD-IIB family hydrolase [Ruegeria profundi]|uniref:HAD-IIB family hydrolase n=1 Tax=Ruegeria profundi TaxID=1685378 RepID=UPI001CD372E5|nr:HAD-IIB family hydrolase [Ruegeria profundi]MCA0928171.1 HAD-IIB family hydrolase [Ruegeria profundi]
MNDSAAHALPLLVFSDLDGTLLDHHDYGWDAAKPGLERLRGLGAGLILASSKTAEEIRVLQQEMGVTDMPAIVENGAGILWPGKPDSNDDDYNRLRAVLETLPKGFLGFGDMTDLDVARETGLSPAQATLARRRRFSEPGLWTGSQAGLQAFLKEAARNGVTARQGGRFLTLSFGRTKADAMAEVIRRLKPIRTIALGDAPNDAEMIQTADQGVVVANPDGPSIPPFPPEIETQILRTTHSGPQGWSEAILTLTSDL